MMLHHSQRGFALLDVLLAVVLLSIVSVGIYEFTSSFQNANTAQSIQGTAMNIAQNYAPFLNQTAVQASPAVLSNNQLLTSFLKSTGIPDDQISSPSLDYSFVKTTLGIPGGRAQMGFTTIQIQGSGNTPAINYFVMGFQATCSQLSNIVQNLNTTFGVFFGKGAVALLSATQHGTIPTCANESDIYSIYLTSPITDVALNSSFTAPGPA